MDLSVKEHIRVSEVMIKKEMYKDDKSDNVNNNYAEVPILDARPLVKTLCKDKKYKKPINLSLGSQFYYDKKTTNEKQKIEVKIEPLYQDTVNLIKKPNLNLGSQIGDEESVSNDGKFVEIKIEPSYNEYNDYFEVTDSFKCEVKIEVDDTSYRERKADSQRSEDITFKNETIEYVNTSEINDNAENGPVSSSNASSENKKRKGANVEGLLEPIKQPRVRLADGTFLPEELVIGGHDRRRKVQLLDEEDAVKNITELIKRGFTCKDCPQKFLCNKQLVEHAITHQVETVHKCPECRKCFPQAHRLVLHMKIHSGDRPFRCRYCPKRFIQNYSAIRHEKIHKTERPLTSISRLSEKSIIDFRYYCAFCNETFQKLKEKRAHVCSAAVSDGNSRSSNGQEDNEEKPYQCDHCNESFLLKTEISKHMAVHNGKHPHPCKLCGKTFTEERGLRQHLQRHAGVRTHPCPVCPASCYTSTSLKRHMRTHSNEKPFGCELCERSFKSRDARKNHNKIVHTNSGTEFKCEFDGCEATYGVKSNMQRHMRSFHYGLKPFQCSFCPSCYTSNASLMTHTKAKHKKIDR